MGDCRGIILLVLHRFFDDVLTKCSDDSLFFNFDFFCQLLRSEEEYWYFEVFVILEKMILTVSRFVFTCVPPLYYFVTQIVSNPFHLFNDLYL